MQINAKIRKVELRKALTHDGCDKFAPIWAARRCALQRVHGLRRCHTTSVIITSFHAAARSFPADAEHVRGSFDTEFARLFVSQVDTEGGPELPTPEPGAFLHVLCSMKTQHFA